ncbi:MAG: pectinesterase family protein [Muribaculum sp.]|nr:pectinesterase family protein [Muribaculum sp.]
MDANGKHLYEDIELADAGTYHLYADNGGSMFFYYLSLEYTDAGSGDKDDEPKEVTVAVSDTLNLLASGDKLVLVNVADATDIHEVSDNDKVTLITKATYKVVLQDSTGKEKDGVAATIGGNNTIKVTAETDAITITLATTVTSVTPTIAGELGTNKLYAVKGSDTIELNDGTAVKLPKNTEYSLVVKNATGVEQKDWVVTVNETDSNKFNTGTDETLTLSIAVEHVTEVKITTTISGKGMLGDNKLYLVAGTEKLEVVSGQELTLVPLKEYTLTIETGAGVAVTDIEATVAAKKVYAPGITAAEITISVSVPPTKTTSYPKSTFAKVNGENVTATEGQLLPGTNIYYNTYKASGVTYDNQLRFRAGNELWLPIQDDTTRITYIQTSNANQTRYVHIGSADSEYKVQMLSGDSSITLDDITDLIKIKDGQKYLPIFSDADVKLDGITWVEYNPVNTVQVTGTIEGAAGKGITSISFKNMDNPDAKIITGTVDAEGKYSAELRRVAGETKYAASIAVIGYKIDDTNDADKFVLTGNGATAEVNLKLADAPVARVTGTISGIPDTEAAVKGTLGVSLIPENEALDPVELTLTKAANGDYTFAEVLLERSKRYGVKLTNADDYEVVGEIAIPDAETYIASIEATEKSKLEVKGSFVTSDGKDAEVKTITFTNMDTPAYTYTFDVTGTNYTANLRAAEYETSVTCKEGYTPYDHVSVKDSKVTNDVYLQGPVDNSPVEYEAEVAVGEGQKFTKIADAVAYISRMTRTDDQRVTIVLDAGATYREQLVINTPNITIKGNDAKLTWYYGVNFSYYSAKLSADGKSAYYDEAYAVDKYYKQAIGQNPGHWGATVNLLAGATGFTAEGLTFENSLNYYVTDEELADGAGANSAATITARAKGIDVFNKAAKERGCVLYIQADNTTYENCKFLSEQDTLYTGDAEENSYFVNCMIEGNTDYIAGDGNAVFDKCTLSMYCYSNQDATDSVIVANKDQATHGYFFNDCKVVRSTTTGSKTTSNITLVRAWGAGTDYFINTEVADSAMINPVGYKDMNAKVADATYYEYNTHTPDGTAVDTSAREANKGKILTKAEADALDMTAFFDGWKPMYFDGTVNISKIELAITAPVAEKPVDRTVSCATDNVTVSGNVAWYEGTSTEAYTGEAYNGQTEYTAKVAISIPETHGFAENVKVVVAGALTASIEKNEDGKTATIIATYKTAQAGYYVIDLSKGLQKGVTYDGGLSVLIDMPRGGSSGDKADPKTVDGKSYAVWVQQPTTNPKPNAGAIPTEGAALKLDAQKDGKLRVILADASGKKLHFIDVVDGQVKKDLLNVDGSGGKEHVFEVEAGHTYYLYGDGTKIVLCGSIIVDYRVIVAAPWDSIENPTIVSAKVSETDPSTIEVGAKGQVGGSGADSMTVVMLDKDGKEVASRTTTNESDDVQTFNFQPASSGAYTFVAHLTREGEEDKVSAKSAEVAFTLPLVKPNVRNFTNKGAGKVQIGWGAVPEAVSYLISYKEDAVGAVESEQVAVTAEMDERPGSEWAYTLPLEVGKTYTVYVQAVRSEDKSEKGSLERVIIKDRIESTWSFAAFGASTTLNNATYNIINAKGEIVSTTTPANGYEGNANDNKVTVWSQGGKGKLVPASTDGLAFYYTQVDPINDNFVLKAKVHVDAWAYSNGQDGFGLMVADRVGANGDATDPFWNNSYMAAVTKIEYRWNKEAGELTTDTDIGSTSMKLGVGTLARTGVPAGWTSPNLPEKFTSTSTTLEYSCSQFGAGTYNIVGNRTNPDSTDQNTLYTDFNLVIERNNTGYKLTYLDQNGKEIESKIYYDEKYFDEKGNYTGTYDAPGQNGTLMQMDPEAVYVGFFASRNATATFTDIEMTVTDARKDAPAEERVKVLVDPSYSIASASNANSKNYDMQFYSNVPGYVTIRRADGTYVANNVRIENENTKLHFAETLKKGKNTYTWTMTPDKDYEIGGKGTNVYLKDYNVRSETFTVTYETFGNKYIYVSPDATSKGKGTADDPVDIATAIRYISAGQTILLDGGTYNLTSSLTISRGISGTAENPIRMMADPSAEERPVIDFGKTYKTGMKLAGDYWILQGFDVTNSGDGTDGLQVCGNHNVLDSLRTYGNGNTGIQLSRLSGSDTTQADWPSYNLVKNCTSYCNADSGYEDADGFAAKLTVGPGNVFDGCIAAYNADDGWDLFAKVETGPIGKVTIKNCIAYGNGYVIGANGEKINAGNGNGFKMGGSSITGYHTLINSMAFDNKAKGIDSNSCPDIQVENCISFNNESYNVAMYTNAGVADTDYSAKGVISYRTTNLGQKEQLNPKGTQDSSKIYNDTNFFWEIIDETDESKNVSMNKSGVKVSADWFASLESPAFGTIIGRHADGTIDLGDFLKLTDKAAVGIGARDLDANGNKSDYLTEDKLADEKVQSVSKGMVVDEIDDQTYTGQAIKPALTISNGLTYLGKNDYTVTYRDNKNVGTATVTIKGKGNYTETISTTFNIVKKNLGDSDVTLQNKVLALKKSNKEQKPKPVVLWKKKKLSLNKDYKVTYFAEADYNANGSKATELSGVKEAGRYVMQIEGINNMEGIICETVVVTDAAHMISKANVRLASKTMQATGAQVQFIADKDNEARNITVKIGQKELTYGTEFELEYENNILPGKATVTVRGKGEYAGEKKVNFTIKGTDIRRATVTGLPTSPVVYAGGAVTLSGLTVTIPNTDPATREERPEITLASGTDFTVSYKNNSKAGSAQIIFTGTGMYSGKLSKSFRITAADITQEYDATITEGDKGHIIVEGLETDYEKGNAKLSNLTVKYYDDASKKTVFLKEGTDYTVAYKRNTAAGIGVVNDQRTPHIIITGKGGFKGRLYKWITINPKKLDTVKTVNRVKKEITVDVKDMAASTKRNGWKSKVVVTDLNNKKMSLRTDYTVEYQYAEGEKAGQTVADTDQPEIGARINVVIKAGTNGNYTGEKKVSYLIYDPVKDIKSARVTVDASKPILYTGEAITLSDVARMYPGENFPISVTARDNTVLVYGKDYEVVPNTYSKNIFKGTAKVTIRGINGYGGTKVLTYKITPKPLKLTNIL